jgi:pSer/pThr/pTyr-binding forkhead associated (FHA) protein
VALLLQVSPRLNIASFLTGGSAMVPCFVALEGSASFRLDDALTVVGRARTCEVRLDSARVSRRHCCLAFGNGEILVRDLESTNGTSINDRHVGAGVLRPGDVLGIAHLRFRLIDLGVGGDLRS